MKTIALAIATLLPLSAVTTPAVAAPVATQMAVHYDDLNLASAEGQKKLDRRIAYAAEKVCGYSTDFRQLSMSRKASQCRDEAIARTSAEVEVAVQNAVTSSPAVAAAAATRISVSN